MSKKDYSIWHTEKSAVEENKIRPGFYEREVWFCIMGTNIGYEQDGRGDKFLRPVVVIKKFNNEVLWAVPLTTKEKQGKYYSSFTLGEAGVSTAILSQLRLIDAKRLEYKIGNMSKDDFKILKTKLTQLIA
jgi:mRNA interferase MazF